MVRRSRNKGRGGFVPSMGTFSSPAMNSVANRIKWKPKSIDERIREQLEELE